MISGDVLKYRNGFLIEGRYKARLTGSNRFPLTLPKRHMRKFNGVPKAQFGLYLKECEWRFNNSDPSSQLSQLRQWVRVYLN